MVVAVLSEPVSVVVDAATVVDEGPTDEGPVDDGPCISIN
jgi:hypothetical protein